MASSNKWARLISSIASFVYFLIIILQVPLFRVPCRTGICTKPLELTSCQLLGSELVPDFVVKALLYPGAIAHAVFSNKTIPSFDGLLASYELTNTEIALATIDLNRLEVLAGSYFVVASALLGLLIPTKMSLCGVLLLLWGLIKEVIFRKHSHLYSESPVSITPAMSIAVLSAFLSVRKDVRKIVRSFRPQHTARFLQEQSKEKFL